MRGARRSRKPRKRRTAAAPGKSAPVAILMGSDSDWGVMAAAAKRLAELGVRYEVRVLSAHRAPAKTASFAQDARRTGVRVIIAGAGGAAHLAGVLAAHTTLPVIGVPLDASSLGGLDALLSTAQMPAGVPVATMSIGEAGADNAAILAAEILALEDSGLRVRLEHFKRELGERTEAKNAALQRKIS